METAPIALFAYNRLSHLQRTVEALQRNELADNSELFCFSDGAKCETDQEKVLAVRKYIHSIPTFKKVTIIEREKNLGLAQSIISGVDEIVNAYGQIIVLEDDMVTSPFFLQYMNDALRFYRDEEQVISVHGYMYPVKAKLPETFFLKGADCWGWGTWKRGWQLFEADGQKLLDSLKAMNLSRQFDFDGSYAYTEMLEEQVTGKNDSWAIRWYASAFLNGKLTLYPGKSLLANTGLDESGTHCGLTNLFDGRVNLRSVRIQEIPLTENRPARKSVKKFFRSLDPSLARRAWAKITNCCNEYWRKIL